MDCQQKGGVLGGGGLRDVLLPPRGCTTRPRIGPQNRVHLGGSSEIPPHDDEGGKSHELISPSSHHKKPTDSSKRMRRDPFGHLPQDLMSMVLSKLDLREAARSSVLSSNWRRGWTIYPKLTLDAVTMCGSEYKTGWQRYIQSQVFVDRKHYIMKFIDGVNSVLHQLCGKVIEYIKIKFEMDAMLVSHLDGWFSLLVSSRTKNLVLDLSPGKTLKSPDRYEFPLQLLDGESASCLQGIQLIYVSFQVPCQFIAFPNLKCLELHFASVTATGIHKMLSNCPNIQRLHMNQCPLNDELIVEMALSCLLHLRLENCNITRIKCNAMKLKTFDYIGFGVVPIELGESSELDRVTVEFFNIEPKEALIMLPNAFPMVQHLTLSAVCAPLKVPYHVGSMSKFSRLRHLLLILYICEEFDSIISLTYFLKAAPFLEKFELQFRSISPTYVGLLRIFSHQPYNCLRDVGIYGFRAARTQSELLLHIMEKAPALQILTIDPAVQSVGSISLDEEREARHLTLIRAIVTKLATDKLSPNTKINLM